MKKLLILVLSCSWLYTVNSQNLILNPGFEQGSPMTNPYVSSPNQFQNVTGWYNGVCGAQSLPTPDLIHNGAPSGGDLVIPGSGVYARNNGATNNRYARILPYYDASDESTYGESVTGTISEALSTAYAYTISCYTARIKWSSCLTSPTQYVDFQYPIEFVLRKDGDCSLEKIVYTSGNIAIHNSCHETKTGIWDLVSGNFTVSQEDVDAGYNRVEIRIRKQPANGIFLALFIDDVSLTKVLKPNAAFSFVTPGQNYSSVSTPFGPTQLTRICASPAPAKTPVLINGGASQNETRYGIKIEEWNPATWTAVAAPIYDAWISLSSEVPSSNININNLPGVNMQIGKIYRVELYVGLAAFHSVSRLVRIDPLPSINAGQDLSVCAGSPVSVNVTTTNWPVKAYINGSTLVGTYYSNPISLSPSVTTNYDFRVENAPGSCSATDNLTVTVNSCSTASFVFSNVLGVSNESSAYGPQEVTTVCLPNVWINGSASANENAYHFWIQEFNLATWTAIGQPLYQDWYANGQVGNVNLSTVIQSNVFQTGKVYIVVLSVGPQWNSMIKFLRVSPCTRGGSDELTVEDRDAENSVIENNEALTVYPNPTDGLVHVEVVGADIENIELVDIHGSLISRTSIEKMGEKTVLDLSPLASGIYFIQASTQKGVIQKKVIKN